MDSGLISLYTILFRLTKEVVDSKMNLIAYLGGE